MSVDAGNEVAAQVRDGEYGTKVATVEPGGAEFIPLDERHGKPIGLFATWMSPNLEFATIFLGIISVWYFQLTIGQAVLAALVGTGLGAVFHGILSARGPKAGVPQMIISRISFGYVGNILPAGLNAVIAGVGWFAVNSVSGALALSAITGMDPKIALAIVVIIEVLVAFFGHNLLQTWERFAFPVLVVIFILGIIFSVGHADSSVAVGGGGIGGFLIVVGATFGYAAGWNPFAADYTRYLSPNVSARATGLWAGAGVFVSCFVLQVVGALAATYMNPEGNPTAEFTSVMPEFVRDLVLVGIVIGSISANAINLYSGSMSFLSMGFTVGAKARRVIAVVIFGALGAILAYWGLENVQSFENFLLVIAYWVGPWLGVVLMDQIIRRRHNVKGFMFDRNHSPASGFLAMFIGMFVSIWLFSNQVFYVGLVPQMNSSFGDIAFEVGFLLSAVLYAIFYKFTNEPMDEALIIPK